MSDIIALIERHKIWLTPYGSGWAADIAGEPGDPDVDRGPHPGQPGHVKATAGGATVAEAVLACVALLGKAE